MRLRLDDLAGSTATETAQPDGSFVVTVPPLTIVLSPLAGLPADDPELAGLVPGLLAMLRRDCPPGGSVRVLSEEPTESAQGWPLRLVHAELVHANGVTEERLGAIYKFLRYTAMAIIQVADAPDESLAAPGLIKLLRSGRPDWRDQEAGAITALWDIWQ